MSTGSYCASESNRYFAWVDSANQYSSNTIKVMDLKSGKTFEVKKGDDQYLRPLGFIGEDFIYGQANAADVVSDAAGNTTFPMNGLIILDTSDQSELKTLYPFGRLCRENFCGWIYGNDRSDCTKQWCVCRNRSGYHYEPGG